MNSNLAVSRNDCGRVLESDPSLFDEGVTKSKSSFLLVFTNILCEFIHYKYCTSVQARLMKGKTRSPVGWTVSWCKWDETVLWIQLYRLCTFWHVFMTGKLFSCAVRRIESAYTTRCKSIVLCNLEWTWIHRHTHTLAGWQHTRGFQSVSWICVTGGGRDLMSEERQTLNVWFCSVSSLPHLRESSSEALGCQGRIDVTRSLLELTKW